MTVNERLKIFAESNNLTGYQISKDTGISEVRIYRLLKGQFDVKSDVLIEIANAYPTLNLNWLLRGQGEMLDRSTILQVERIAA